VKKILPMVILSDSRALKKRWQLRWPEYVSEIETMHLTAETLVPSWEKVKTEFKDTKTLKDKNLLIAMMYQP